MNLVHAYRSSTPKMEINKKTLGLYGEELKKYVSPIIFITNSRWLYLSSIISYTLSTSGIYISKTMGYTLEKYDSWFYQYGCSPFVVMILSIPMFYSIFGLCAAYQKRKNGYINIDLDQLRADYIDKPFDYFGFIHNDSIWKDENGSEHLFINQIKHPDGEIVTTRKNWSYVTVEKDVFLTTMKFVRNEIKKEQKNLVNKG